MIENDEAHGPDAGLVCTRLSCDRHPGHDDMGHCESCIDDSNAGYNDARFTFRDAEPPCCCRDVRRLDDDVEELG